MKIISNFVLNVFVNCFYWIRRNKVLRGPVTGITECNLAMKFHQFLQVWPCN